MIKIEVKQIQSIKYPCLMKAIDGKIVLFYADGCGISLKDGYQSDNWPMQCFDKFTGEITLRNE